jgi:hypothetical protein
LDEGGDFVVFRLGMLNAFNVTSACLRKIVQSLRKNFASTIAIFRAKMEWVSEVLQFPVIIE